MSRDADKARLRLLRHLAGEPVDREREELEDALLSDEGLFEELASAEDDLVDAYLRGELPAENEELLGQLFDRAPRLRESAELGAALAEYQRWQAHRAAAANAGSPQPSAPENVPGARPLARRRAFWVLSLVALILLSLVTAWQSREQARLSSELKVVSDELERAQEENLELRRRLAREQAKTRLLSDP